MMIITSGNQKILYNIDRIIVYLGYNNLFARSISNSN